MATLLGKILKTALAAVLIMDAFGASAFAQGAQGGALYAQNPMPEGSAPLEELQTPVLPAHSPLAGENRQPLTPEEYFSDPKTTQNLKLFEPARYEFLHEGTPLPLLLPPPQNEEEADYEDYYRYSRQYLENVIKDTEGAIEIRERGIEYLEILNPSLMVPIYGTTISLTGRKTFGLNYHSKKYKGKRVMDTRDQSGVEFEQEMQVKLQGKISDRIFVDIDYDDQREDAQNISVAYRGKENEVVQSADFGDIELTLPNTEFLSYSKQVFGAKMHLKMGDAHLRIIGSQTKGTSKSKQFKGDNVFETVTLRDTQYIRYKYYDLNFNEPLRGAIVNGSERIYLDDHTNNGYQVAMIATDFKRPATRYPQGGATGAFRLLNRGVDYVIDYNRAILIFNTPLRDNDVVAVDYESVTQGPVNAKIIKTSGSRPIESADEIGYQLEIKRYYDIGAKQISRDNGQGNFILKLQESDGRETCPPQGAPGYCVFMVDYDKGIFEIRENFPDPGIYASTPRSAANRSFFVQFSSTVRTYFLEPDIVVQSESVKINGATMARNRDYYVDYASGFITFYKEELIGSGSVIDITYETASGGAGESSLLGGRFNYDFTRNISIGASLIQESGSQPKRVPNVGALSSSLTVMEADLKAKDVEVMDGVKISAGVEAAQSKKDENLFGMAMIDNLEETKETIQASTSFDEWLIAANPNGLSPFFDAIKWDTEEVNSLEINQASTARLDARQNVLAINYNFDLAVPDAQGDREVSLVYPLSPQGLDFTQKTLLELTAWSEAGGPEIDITFGTIDERSDRFDVMPAGGYGESDVYPTCSKYYAPGQFYVPKTEDMQCTGALTAANDIGWMFVQPDGTMRRYDPFAAQGRINRLPQPNGRIDTQDLNGNGLYDSEDISAGGHFIFDGNYSGNDKKWKQFEQEYDFGDISAWSAIKHVRITLRRKAADGGKAQGAVKIANLAVSGSAWQPMDASATAGDGALVSYGINNIDNGTRYKPIFNDNGDGGQVFRALYGSVSELRSEGGTNNIKEQSLALTYDFDKALGHSDLNVQHNFSRMDFSQHREFRFLLYNTDELADGSNTFYLRVSTDEQNYSEIEIPLDFAGQWRLYTLKLIDTSGSGAPTRWENASKYPATVRNESSGSYLNFKRISTIKAGVRTSTGAGRGEVWLDEIHLADSITRTGNAYMGEAKIDVDGWFEAGGKYTMTDADFQTPLAVPAKQKNTKEDYFVNIKKFQNLPIAATYHRSTTVTPDVLDYDSSNTVSLIDAGEVSRQGGTVRADYIKPRAPRTSVEYAFDNADYQAMQRSDARQYYAANIDYSPTGSQPLVKNVTAGASYNASKINYSDTRAQEAPLTNYNTDESTQNYNLKLALQPWKGASIMPSYSLTTVDEKRREFNTSSSQFLESSYDKSASQSAGVSAALRFNDWLAPTASYSITTRESNNLTPLTYYHSNTQENFAVGQVKTVNRMSDGNFALTLNGKEIAPKSQLFAGLSISGSYRMQDGDSWENVDEGFSSLDELWIRSSMGLNAPYTYRSKLTLRDIYTSALRWAPFQQYAFTGWRAPFKTLSVMNNFSRSFQTTEDLGSAYDSQTTTLPDVVVFMDEIDKFWGGGAVSSTNLKLKYNATNTQTVGVDDKTDISYGADLRFILLNYFDNTFSYSQQQMDKIDERISSPLESYTRRDFSAQSSFNYKRLRFTPKFTYLYDTRTQVGDVMVSEVEEFVPSLNIRADFNLPMGLKLPFISRQYLMTNRVIWNTNISYSQRRSYTVSENRDLLDINTNFDYELSKNIRFTVTGAMEIFKHKYIEEESYTAYTIGTLMTVQF